MIAPTEEELAAMSVHEQGYLRALRTYLEASPHDWRSEACLGIMDRTLAMLDEEQMARVGAWVDKMQSEEQSEG